MTTHEWIEAAVSVATFLTALAALLSVRLMRQQRLSQVQPDIVFDDRRFTAFQRGSAGRLGLEMSNHGSVPDSNLLAESGLFLRVRNVGLGVAKDVTIRQHFDALALVSRVADASPEIAERIEVGDRFVSAGGWAAVCELTQRDGSLLPVSLADERTLRLSPSYVRLVLEFLRGCNSDPELAFSTDFSLPPLKLDISFTDLEGVRHTQRHTVTVEVFSYTKLRGDPGQVDWTPFCEGMVLVRQA